MHRAISHVAKKKNKRLRDQLYKLTLSFGPGTVLRKQSYLREVSRAVRVAIVGIPGDIESGRSSGGDAGGRAKDDHADRGERRSSLQMDSDVYPENPKLAGDGADGGGSGSSGGLFSSFKMKRDSRPLAEPLLDAGGHGAIRVRTAAQAGSNPHFDDVELPFPVLRSHLKEASVVIQLVQVHRHKHKGQLTVLGQRVLPHGDDVDLETAILRLAKAETKAKTGSKAKVRR